MFHNILSRKHFLSCAHFIHYINFSMRSRSTDFCLLILSHFRSCTCTHNLETQYRLSFLPFCNRVSINRAIWYAGKAVSIFRNWKHRRDEKKKKQLIHRSHEWPDENWANLERRCSLLFSDFDVNPEKGALTQSILLAGK